MTRLLCADFLVMWKRDESKANDHNSGAIYVLWSRYYLYMLFATVWISASAIINAITECTSAFAHDSPPKFLPAPSCPLRPPSATLQPQPVTPDVSQLS